MSEIDSDRILFSVVTTGGDFAVKIFFLEESVFHFNKRASSSKRIQIGKLVILSISRNFSCEVPNLLNIVVLPKSFKVALEIQPFVRSTSQSPVVEVESIDINNTALGQVLKP